MSESKNYLIIGGSSGIGLTLARIEALKGNLITVAARKTIVEPLITSITFDATKDDLNVSSLPQSIDGLVYCPGSVNLKPFHRLTDQEFLDDFNLNVLGAIKVIRATLPLLKNAESASIILFSTVAVAQGMPFHSSVATSKGAIEGLAKSLAAEFAPKIRVNVIAPSLTDTPLAIKLLSSEEKKKASGERHPLKRVGESKDIAEIASFLLSEKSSWITGQVFHVDGGLSTLRIM